MLSLPCRTAIIDCEIVACRKDGVPDFRALHSGNYTREILCVWSFDLMELNGEDLRPFPLIARKQKLGALLHRHDHPYVRYSEPFKNGERLLAECRQRGLEGVVSKRKHAPYKSGKCDWVKVKCAQWKEDNKDRGDLFVRPLFEAFTGAHCGARIPSETFVGLPERQVLDAAIWVGGPRN